MSNLPETKIPSGLPEIDELAYRHSQAVQAILAKKIEQAGGCISFEQWMGAALYEPGYGYYSAGSTKFNAAGDFITAPEATAIFGQTLSNQVLQILTASNSNVILEFGAGTGALAKSILQTMARMEIDVKYQILELSADLRQRQQQTLAGFEQQVSWLEALPQEFNGCVIANEVLDAMPVNLFQADADNNIEILGVGNSNATELDTTQLPGDGIKMPFVWQTFPDNAGLTETIKQRIGNNGSYLSEINLQAEAWVKNLGNWLNCGAAILIDYGFPQNEYYHPQRKQGTLMCHLRHHAHDQPLILPGIQDITAHIDFTAMADAALQGNLNVLGYTSQARFLLNCGLTEQLGQFQGSAAARTNLLANVNMLISEAEMGELFKVMVVGKGIEPPLLGFMHSDRRDFL